MTAPNSNPALNDGKQVNLPPEMCDNDCGRPADPGCRDGVGRLCRQCHRGSRLGFDRQTRMKLATEAEHSIARATAESPPAEVAKLEMEEGKQRGGMSRFRPRNKAAIVAPLYPSPEAAAIPPLAAPKPAPVPTPAPVVERAVPAPKAAPDRTLPKLATVAGPPGPRPFLLRPNADALPHLCRRAGCLHLPKTRGFCKADHRVASRLNLLEKFGLPRMGTGSTTQIQEREDFVERVVAYVMENPGVHADTLIEDLILSERRVHDCIRTLRQSGRLARPSTHHRNPEYWRLNLPKVQKSGSIRADILGSIQQVPGVQVAELMARHDLDADQIRHAVASLRAAGLIHAHTKKPGYYATDLA